jgi:hypothetical protein
VYCLLSKCAPFLSGNVAEKPLILGDCSSNNRFCAKTVAKLRVLIGFWSANLGYYFWYFFMGANGMVKVSVTPSIKRILSLTNCKAFALVSA